ncbi:MAG: site-2 protease family protein [Firmicutes bacterium]|nr:site-2 protease family protein [Bacillota bacterium]
MLFNTSLETMMIMLPGIIIGLVFHEYAHGYIADRLGDPTPAYSNRLSLNPLVHLDIFGFLMILFTGFGWAKPIPINPARFKGNQRIGLVLVSIAGCCANMIVAFTGCLIYNLSVAGTSTPLNSTWVGVLGYLISINIMLGIFNLIPIPPLDGSRVIAAFIPYRYLGWYYQLERYGLMVLMLLIFFTGFFSYLRPVMNGIFYIMNSISAAIAGIIF